jgi:tetratricopeptide (TPR) repeat protein
MRYFFLACFLLSAMPVLAQETNVTVTPSAPAKTTINKQFSIEGLWRSDSGLTQAEKLLSENKYSDALSVLDQVLVRNPRSADAYIDSAYAWLNLGNNDKAKSSVANALVIDKTHMGAYVISGILALQDKDRAQAENYLGVLKTLCHGDTCPEFQTLQRIIRETKPDQS